MENIEIMAENHVVLEKNHSIQIDSHTIVTLLVLIFGVILLILGISNPLLKASDEEFKVIISIIDKYRALTIGIGIILIVIAILIHITPRTILPFKKNKIVISLGTRGQITILIKDFATVSCKESNQDAVILPVNTSFVDDCFTNPMTSTGAFVGKKLLPKILDFQKHIEQEIKEIQLSKNKEVFNYDIGDIVSLSNLPLNEKVFLLATVPKTTSFKTGINEIGICIKKIMQKMEGEQHINVLHIPIIGSGHGQVPKDIALRQMLLSIIYHYREYAKLKEIIIYIHPNDKKDLSFGFVSDMITVGKK